MIRNRIANFGYMETELKILITEVTVTNNHKTSTRLGTTG